MTNKLIADIKAIIAEFEADATPVENDVKAIGSSALSYIETNGLQDLYQIALSAVAGAVAGAPWAATLATIESQAVTAGKSIEKGAVAVVAAQAQADLIAAGTVAAPTSTPAA